MAMRRDEESARNLSNRALISEITDRATRLARKELELAKAEIRADLNSELVVAKALGVAAVAMLAGLNLFLVAVVLALATAIPGWLAAVIVGGLMLALSGVMAYIGWRKHVANPLALTRKSLKEDMQWLKERVA